MTGRNTPHGFMPDTPSIDDILKRVDAFGKAPVLGDGVTQENDMMQSPRNDLLKCYQSVFASPDGQRVLDDLLDQTLRRAVFSPGNATIEQVTLNRVFRDGQNHVVCHILKSLHDAARLLESGPAQRNNRRRK